MKLTRTLLGFLNRVFDKDPYPFVALRIAYDGGLTWVVEDGVLTTSVSGGIGVDLTIALSEHTLMSLAQYIAGQDGYSVTSLSNYGANLSALVLLDGSGDLSDDNGDKLLGYTSILYSYMEANATELALAESQIQEMLNQLNVNSGEGEWLDLIGSYYGVKRGSIISGGVSVREPDNIYGPRIIQEVLRPRGNNVALELAISNATGGLPSAVVDAPLYSAAFPSHDATISYDGTYHYDSTAKKSYNLFDVQYAFNLEGAEDIDSFAARVLEVIEKFRDAGTHMRSIALRASALSDIVPERSDSFSIIDVAPGFTETVDPQSEDFIAAMSIATFSDAQVSPSDNGISESIVYMTVYDGVRAYNGSVPHQSGNTVVEAL